MEQDNADIQAQYRRSILIGLGLVLTMAVVAAIAALIVPFDVRTPVIIQSLTGDVMLVRSNGQIVPLAEDDTDIRLTRDQGLRLAPGDTATIVFEINGARAILVGPAELTLRKSTRRATMQGHITDDADYTLTLEQRLGTVRYYFANTDPPLADVAVTIRLPQSNYLPDSPCWEITIESDGSASPQAITCP